jgi:alkylated DNA repair dioxygenase AlkB
MSTPIELKPQYKDLKIEIDTLLTDLYLHCDKEQEKMSVTEKQLVALDCIRPAFRGALNLDTPGHYILDKERGSSVLIVHNMLGGTLLQDYIQNALSVERKGGKSAFGAMKPREEVCYTPDGKPYKYSGKKHYTTKFPPHVLEIINVFLGTINGFIPDNEFQKASTGVDIEYSDKHDRGGSIGAHKDDEDPNWGMVVVYSLGQTRWLRVRNVHDKTWCNIKLPHNSMVVMHGKHFQQDFTHQIDKLKEGEPVGKRLSLNIRFERS